eukprot:TRINITY_DN21006_c0_g1_i2.p1 TRINITY_DN21006_c0_g1~~TRINITY_DN21006_c0_g1_i2.p1  ORF type:complete len:637 (+),score=88.65 TRINITY_DN21006_c0_g1_i2:79-1911(+)
MAAHYAPRVHIFTYVDNPRPTLCTLANSVHALGGYINVIGLGDDEFFGGVPHGALDKIADALAEQGRTPRILDRRGSAPITCHTRAACSKPSGLAKIRKFFALRRYLQDFDDEDLLFFLDGFDSMIEAPTLDHLVATFDRLQLRAGPLVTSRGGPVIFSGERNCWPFPNSGEVSGDYRADFVYELGNRTRLRGDEICEYWARLRQAGHFRLGRQGGSLIVPFINSGVFAGRVGSLRQLFHLASETLQLFGDFEDQGLVYAMALRAASAERPWVPLLLDDDGELLGSLHGMDLKILAQRQQAPQVCDFYGRLNGGYFSASLGVARAQWPKPLVVHCNGDKKEFFEKACGPSVLEHLRHAGVDEHSCSWIDYVRQLEVSLPLSRGRLPVARAMPRPLVVPSLAQVIGAKRLAASPRRARELLLALVPARAAEPPAAVVAEEELHAGCGRGGGAGSAEREGGASFPDLVVLRRNATAAGRPGRSDYCSLGRQLRAAWARLRPASRESAGMLWMELRADSAYHASVADADAKRFERACDVYRDDAAGDGAEEDLDVAFAVADFLAALPPSEATRFRWVQPYRARRQFGRPVPALSTAISLVVKTNPARASPRVS